MSETDNMFRTNHTFLSYIDDLYTSQSDKAAIVLQYFDEGRTFLTQGEPSTKVYVIKEGISKCFFNEENGKDYIVEFLGKGEILGEIEVIKKMSCLCNVAAVTAIEVYAISVPFFRNLLEKDLALNKLLLEELAERIINTSSRASFQQLYTVEHGLAKLLELQEKQGITIFKDDMAAYLGITLRSLNRALKVFKGVRS